MWNQWNSMVGMLNKLGTNLQSLRCLVSEDVLLMDEKVTRVEARVGETPQKEDFDDCGTVWEGLQLVNHTVKDTASTLSLSQEELAAALRQLENRVGAGLRELEGSSRAVQQKVDNEVTGLQTAMVELATALQTLSSEQEKLSEVLLAGSLGSGSNSAHQSELKLLTTRLTLLEARIPSSVSGRLGGDSFQSRVDVALFVESHVPSNSFYLFHDVVTLLEALTISHVEHKDVLDEWYRSSKVGVNEASARHMASFRLILPTVFGRVKEGSTASTKHHLPSVHSFKEWNTFDGVSGVKSFIAAGMDDLKYQFRQDIDHAMDYASHAKARLLATEMHESAQNFVMEMSSWMDAFYQELVSTSESTEEKA
jgi:hypothetical protein